MTIDQLLAESIQMLEQLGVEQDPQSRVSAWPDLRSFRMYRTQKLIDDPNTKVGVSGVYGRKHVLQLVALKAMQAQRLPLREIRTRLAGMDESALAKWLSGSTAPLPRTKTKTVSTTPAQKIERWIQVPLAEGAFAMVMERLLTNSRPSSVRALGDQLSAHLLALRS